MDADEIQNKKFKVKMRGYDRNEVDAYAHEVARTMDNLETANQHLQQELYKANQELDGYHDKEQTLNRSIVVAQQAADRVREEAIKEADQIIQKAQEESQKLLTQAAEKATAVNTETSQLQEAGRTFAHTMLGMTRQIQDVFEDERWKKIFSDQPVEEVETPNLDEIIDQLDLPIRNDKAGEIFDLNEEKINQEKDKEDFLNQAVVDLDDQMAAMPEEETEPDQEAANERMDEDPAEEADSIAGEDPAEEDESKASLDNSGHEEVENEGESLES